MLQNSETCRTTITKVWYRHGDSEKRLRVKKQLHPRQPLRPFSNSGKKKLLPTFVKRRRRSYQSWRGTEATWGAGP